MSIQIDLSEQLELRLQEEAAKAGVHPEDYVVATLSRYLQVEPNVSAATDDELLEFISGGLSESDWTHYYELVQKREQELISETELDELVRLTDRIEHLNAARAKCLVELASRRGISLDALMQQLGIEVAMTT
jgi:transcriptional regulator with XRE-family HTH domain